MQNKESDKYNKRMCKDTENTILHLHSKGKTNIEIGKAIGFSNTSVRLFLKRNGLKSNKKESKLKEVNCQICNKIFMPSYHGRDKVCSSKCSSELIRQSKIKYSQNDIDKVVEYKSRKFTNNEIQQLTGVNINKIKEIVNKNDLFLSPKDVQANVYRKKLEANPNCMQEMRETRMSCTTNEYNQKMFKIIEILEDPENNQPSTYIAEKFGITPRSLAQGLRCRGREDLIQPTKSSADEEKIADMIAECIGPDVEIIRGDRKILKPKEIDIYIPSLNLAIEYCGLYWHTENSPEPRGRNYHYEKMAGCNKNDIRLITIFEDEWRDRNSQVKNFLKSVLGVAEKRIFARKCEIKEVDKKIAKIFLDENHIQGKTTMKVAFGLYYEDKLVGLVTGNQHHRQKDGKGPFVLNRLVFKDGHLIVGGASRLLKKLISYAKEEGYKELISWSDNRWSQGNVYKKTGFTFVEELKPDYSYYTGNGERESKQSNKKCKLLKKGAIGTMENTENELAKSIGYSRVWDCGKIRWSISL